ncbi:MAG: prolipoprotein diacylglyceryl transferase [Actinobacteria bacterium]|nr:prolipoprotein diacylglyceryl transferase [Actinomycetota bacterium]
MRPILFNIGPLAIHSWGVLVGLGVLAGVLVARKRAAEIKLPFDHIIDLALYLLAGGLIGGRLLYLTFYPSKFLANPLEIFSVWQGGMSIHGGILGGIIAGVIFAGRRKLSFWRLADVVAPSLALGQAVGRIGCFLNGDSYGLATSVPWAVKFPGLSGLRHPTQIYEAVLDLIAFIFLWRRRERTAFDGELFLTYAIAYSIIRGIVEFFRASPKVLGPISPAQIASLAVIFVAGSLIVMARYRARLEKAAD